MGKFKYSMQNILDIKIKLETQAKNEFSEANRAYLIEKEKLEELFKKRAVYEAALMNTVKSVILDISGGGIRFSLSTPLEEGTYFMAQFSLALEECTQQFNIVCKVINCTQSLDYADRYFARSKFIFDRMTEREKIVRFVFEEERRIRRREME